MDSFELNKILGAILGACLVLLITNFTANALFAPQMPAKPGFVIAVNAPAKKATTAPKKAVPIETLLQTASAQKGKAIANVCKVCHTLAKGEPNHVGPNLWGIVGDKRGVGRGFNFSAAMKAKGGTWTDDELNKFLTSPGSYIPGTAMGFAGIQNDSKRADVIAYLHTLSDHPIPLPTASKSPTAAKK